MTWVKISSDWVDNADTEALGSDAAMLLLSMLAYSARHGTDGHVSRIALRKLWPVVDLERALAKLTTAGQVTAGELSDDLYLPEWHEFILSADELGKMREKSRTTSERYRRHQRGDHSMCDRCKALKGRPGDDVTDPVTDRSPSRYASSRLVSKEKRDETRAAADALRAPVGASHAAARWRAWGQCPQTLEAHPFIPDVDGICAWMTADRTDLCEGPASHQAHGHRMVRVSPELPECQVCGQDSLHAVHGGNGRDADDPEGQTGEPEAD